jgi:solute carrier family 40 (iron-regulated transporter), member 1
LITSVSSRLLVGRLLTRSGDQAWDFAVPIVLLKILPDQLRIAALYYLLIRLLSVILIPRIASMIDTKDRVSVIRIGLVMQFVGVFFGGLSIYALWSLETLTPGVFVVLVLSGLVGSLGASLMDIAIASDLAPSIFSGQELSKFNSRFRQVDLTTEVGAPVLAGLLLTVSDAQIPLLGFLLVVLWNLISFFPEFGILRSVFKERPELNKKSITISEGLNKPFIQKLIHGWRAFFNQPTALVMIAYALLWVSVLSPHGVLLTGFLQDGWRLPELVIGLFRGSGAFFGLAATLLFPFALKYMSVERVSGFFLGFQGLTVLVAYGLFLAGGESGQIGFLILVLLSRIGLYGFSLGEVQIRQERIAPELRGQVNGFASALTGMATITLFSAGATLPTTQDFRYLVLLSVTGVLSSFVIYMFWMTRSPGRKRER